MAHIPALNPQQMAAVIARLKTLTLSDDAKQRIALMLLEAANADRHNVDRLDAGRASDMKATAAAVRAQYDGILARTMTGLAAISDDEWDAMVAEANEGG